MTKIPKSTVYRILCTLELRGLVQYNEKTSQYKLGLRLMEFGFVVSSVLDIRIEAEEILADLQAKTNQTILMAVQEGDEIIYIYTKEKYAGLKFSSYVGQRRPFLYGVLGPTLLAFLPEHERDRIMNIPIDYYTHKTVTDKDIILNRLNHIKKNGFFIESNETTIGVTGIGAPIFGRDGKVIAAIGAIGSAVKVDEKIEEIKHLVLEASYHISLRMGYHKSNG